MKLKFRQEYNKTIETLKDLVKRNKLKSYNNINIDNIVQYLILNNIEATYRLEKE